MGHGSMHFQWRGSCSWDRIGDRWQGEEKLPGVNIEHQICRSTHDVQCFTKVVLANQLEEIRLNLDFASDIN